MTGVPMIFIRHGETDWNREARLQGQRDIPLNALGRRQAARNGRILPLLLGDNEWCFIASPLGRAIDTMTIIFEAAGMTDQVFETDDRLMEMCFGRWEGLTLAEVAQKDPQGEHRREVEKWSYVPPDGESYADLSTRIGGWLADRDGPVVVVGHGGVLRVLHHRLGGVAAAAAPHLAVPQDRITVFARGHVITI